MSRRPVLAAIVAACVSALVFSGAASATPPTPASGATWNPNQHVYYRWKEGIEPPSWMKSTVNASAGDSNASRDSKAAILGQSDSGTSWIGYTGDIPSTYAVGYTVGNAPSYFGIRLRPQGYALDWGTLKWCQFYSSPPDGCYDAELITLHEMGHAQSLDHPDDADVTSWTDTIMHWAPKSKPKAGWNQHEFGRCDVARLQIRYEAQTPSTPYSTCLDLASDLTLTSSASTIEVGSTVTLTARLNVADSVSWPLLAGDPAAGRQVTLQKRPTGGSGWTSVGAMSSVGDTGQYSKSLAVNNSFDYRAVFSPNGEGMNASTSAIVHVTVTSTSGSCVASQRANGRFTSIYIC